MGRIWLAADLHEKRRVALKEMQVPAGLTAGKTEELVLMFRHEFFAMKKLQHPGTLKVFDIVRTMTAGNYETSVVANEMYTQAFRAGEPGRGAALALVLFLLVLPIVVYNARVLRQQREIR